MYNNGIQLKIIDDMYKMSNTMEISYDELFEFEKMIVGLENIETIREYISEIPNENLIYDKTMLCNGYYKKKFKIHPNVCHNCICYKSPLYYSLWLNSYYYQLIFTKIKLLASLSTKEIISDFLDFIYELPCLCHTTTIFKQYYDHNDMNFDKVETFLKNKMVELFNTYEDYKSRLTKKQELEKHIKMTCDLNCKHNIKIKKVNFIQDEINNHDKIGDFIFEIKHIWEKYLKNVEITKFLFGMQSYEYYNINLNYKKLDTENALDNILLNKYTNINFCKNDNDNILYNTLKQDCKSELIVKIIEHGGKLPKNKNLESMFENNECKIENIKTFLKYYDAKYFSNESLLVILKQNLMRTHKINIVDIFASRGLLSNAIKILLESEDSHNILLNLYNSEDVVCSKIELSDALFCIKLEKYKELDLILKHNKSFVDAISNENITPVMIAIKENKLRCLQLLLQHGADPFYSHNGMSPIKLTILENRLDMLEFLLENWMKHCSTSDNTSHIMLAIKENNVEVLKLLLKYNADPFSNVGNTTPTLFAIENDKYTSLECLLQHGEKIGTDTNSIANVSFKHVSPLSLAIDKNKLIAFELLLKYGANPFIYTSGLNILHYAIYKNNYECVSLIKDYAKNSKFLINELTSDEHKKHAIFLAILTKDPIKFTDLLLQNPNINVETKLNDGSNIFNYILASSNNLNTKINLMKRYINKNIDLTNQVNGTPLVVYAVEKNMYDIVVMIINKLIEIEEIKINGYNNNDNIINIISTSGNKKLNITSKSKLNYYSLVLLYLKNGKIDDEENEDENNDKDSNITKNKNVEHKLMNNTIDSNVDKNILLNNLFCIYTIVLLGYIENNKLNKLVEEMSHIYEKIKKAKDEENLMKYLTKLIDNYYNNVYFIQTETHTKNFDNSNTFFKNDNIENIFEFDYDQEEHVTLIDTKYTDICFPVYFN